jgi:hypothetical protein
VQQEGALVVVLQLVEVQKHGTLLQTSAHQIIQQEPGAIQEEMVLTRAAEPQIVGVQEAEGAPDQQGAAPQLHQGLLALPGEVAMEFPTASPGLC